MNNKTGQGSVLPSISIYPTTLKLCIALFFLLLSDICLASSPVDAKSFADKLKINNFLEYYWDNKGLDFNQVQSQPDSAWHANEEGKKNFGFSTADLWLRFSIDKVEEFQDSVLIDFGYPHVDVLNVFFVQHGSVVEKFALGDSLRFDARPLNTTTPIVAIPSGIDGRLNVYVQLQTDGPKMIPLSLKTEAVLNSEKNWIFAWYGAYAGIMLIMFLYNCLTYVLLRNLSYLYYLAYVVSIVALQLNLEGLCFQWFWPLFPELNNPIMIVLAGFMPLCAVLFIIEYLDLMKLGSRIDKACAVFLLYTFLGIIIFSTLLPYNFLLKVTFTLAYFALGLGIYLGIKFSMVKKAVGNIFAFAWISYIGFILIYLLDTQGVVNFGFMGQRAMQIGSVIETALLSLAIAQRINAERKLLIQEKERRSAAESATQAKSLFLANMSHEIRTPMNGVTGIADLLAQTPLNSQQKRYVELVKSSSKSLLSIINDILDYSKIESGKLEVECIPTRLYQQVDDCVAILEQTIEEKGLKLFYDFDPHIPLTTNTDPTRVRQILLNLLSNAVKFTHQGYITVKTDQLPNNYIRVSVIDSGVGLSQAAQQAIFRAYSQADASVSRHYGGTGLGLTISKMLAELMGGKIGVNSKEGVGSEFWFTYKNSHAGFIEPPASDSIWPRLSIPLFVAGFDMDVLNHFNRLWRHQFSEVKLIEDANAMVDALSSMRNLNSNDADNLPRFVLLTTDKGFHWIKDSEFITSHKRQIYMVTRDSLLAEDLRRSRGLVHVLEDGLRLEDFRTMGLQAESERMRGNADTMLDLSGLNIMVAEDNPVNQVVIQGMLKRFNANLIIVPDGEKAVIHYKENHRNIDLILMDIEMPTLNGFVATDRVRAFEKTLGLENTPIFGLSAHALEQYKEEAEAVGMNGFITKPLNLNDLKASLSQFDQTQHRNESSGSSRLQLGDKSSPILIH